MKDVVAFSKKLGITTTPSRVAGSKIYACEVTITPVMADKWLANYNTHNRKMRVPNIERIKADIRAGKWLLSHQGISFDENGIISVGQHRLRAVVDTGIPIRSLIFLNCPCEERKVVDQHANRNVLDVAHLGYGDSVTTNEVKAARSMAYGSDITSHSIMTAQEIYAFIIKHRKSINFVLSTIPNKQKGITIAPVIGVLCRAYYAIDQESLRHFIEVLSTGFSTKNADAVVIKLRNKLNELRDSLGTHKTRTRVWQLTEQALYLYTSGKVPERLQLAPNEIYKLPAK